ncbi:trehalose-phosphatase [Hymenobacter tibetensis]|uniref:trehalose-phosphatase n=1 Tax=Hymenobacter tibetensis TaxID=497967 RepID=UPI00293E111A|nr:trehalose-phosphatase [Hymenobacter tibetensis]
MATQVAIISGRDRHTLTKWFGDLPIGLIAEHGAWLRPPNEEWSLIHTLRSEWQQEMQPVMELYVGRTAGSYIEQKDFSLAWHFRRADPELGLVRARELMSHLTFLASNTDLQVVEGDKVVEVRNAGIHKGAAALRWISLYQPDYILALGNDHTDEDMFRAVPSDAYTIKVGISPRSEARHHVPRINDARRLLQRLLAPAN